MKWRIQSKFRRAYFRGEPVLIVFDDNINNAFLLYKESGFANGLSKNIWNSEMRGVDGLIYNLIHNDTSLKSEGKCFNWFFWSDKQYLKYYS